MVGGSVRDPWLWLAALLPAVVVLAAWDQEFFYPDESRHAMNGVLIHDYLRTLGSPGKFAYSFYARFPALSLGYHPPFFPFVEAIVYSAFGVSVNSARLTVMLFAVGGSICFYRWLKSVFGYPTALLSSAALWTAPVVVKWSQAIMLDVPAMSLMIGSLAFFAAYLRSGKYRLLLTATVVAALAASTRQPAGITIVLIALGLAIHEGFRAFTRLKIVAAFLLFTVLLLPTVFLTMKFGMVNLDSNVAGEAAFPLLSVENWTYYPCQIPGHIGWPMTVLAALGVVTALFRREYAKFSLPLLWIGLNYVVFSLIGFKSPRLGMLWCPALAIFAGVGGIRSLNALRVRPAYALIPGLVFFGWQKHVSCRPELAGFGPVAAFVDDNYHGSTVLYDGYQNGNFIFEMRRRDPRRKRIVLRASKSLYATRIMQQFGTKNFVANSDEIVAFLSRHRTGLVVVERENVLDHPVPRLLRETIARNPDLFQLVGYFLLKTDSEFLDRASPILVYKFLGEFAHDGENKITLHFLSTGETVEVPLE